MPSALPNPARPLLRPLLACAFGAACLAGARRARAQAAPVLLTRAQAVDAALARAARLGVARADTAAAYAGVLTAGARQNPALSASYSQAVPRYHVIAELPLTAPALRRARVGAAQAGRAAARFRFAAERAAVALAADTAYTRALAARERLALSARNARAADSLRLIAARRRDAGDASDLDVELALVNAGQQANVAANDSLAYASAVLDLQAAIGLADADVAVAPTDSLTAPLDGASAGSGLVFGVVRPAGGSLTPGAPRAASVRLPPASRPGAPLAVAAAQAALESARLGALAERRSILTAPSVTAGVEFGDPTGAERGPLPTVGLAVPLPFFNRNRGPVALAEAERERARAELALAEVESRTALARTRRTLRTALDRVRRSQALVVAANSVAARSLTAYREGASALPAVLEAQRNARDVLAQYVADLADAWVASATLRALSLTSAGDPR